MAYELHGGLRSDGGVCACGASNHVGDEPAMNKLLAFGGILAVVGGLVLLVKPVGHIPLLDANRTVLAETQRQGYCAGEAFWRSNGYGNAASFQECMSESTIVNDIDVNAVQPAFCQAVTVEGYAGGVDACLDIVRSQKLWPTMAGGLTDAWNRRFPYPLDRLTAGQVPTQNSDESRTGDRTETGDREEGIR
jgi:hypothetical protein